MNNADSSEAQAYIYTPNKYPKYAPKIPSYNSWYTQNKVFTGSTNKPRFQHDEQAIAWTFHHARTRNHPLQWPIRITKRSMIPNYSFLPRFHTNDTQSSPHPPKFHSHTSQSQLHGPPPETLIPKLLRHNPTRKSHNPHQGAPKTAYAPPEFDFPEP